MYGGTSEYGLDNEKLDVLIVEDEPIARRALLSLMSARGYQADSASSAEDALDCIVRHGLPKVALVDLELPGMSGVELIRRLEALSPSIFAVLITAAEGEVVERIRQRFPVAYLPKPLDIEKLMNLIDRRPTLH